MNRIEPEFHRANKSGCYVDSDGQFWSYVGHRVPDAIDGRVPISSRAEITMHNGQTYRLGDILVRPGVDVPLVLIGSNSLDYGSGFGGVVMRDTHYKRIGSIYEDITPLLPMLAARNEKIDFEFYGMERF